MADYITVLSGEHLFRVKDPEEFCVRCRNILGQIYGGDYSVEIEMDKESATIFGGGLNFSLAGALEDPDLWAEEDGLNPVLELRNLIEEYALEPCTMEEIGWEKCRYVTHAKYNIGPKENAFIIALAEKGMMSSTWLIRGTANLAIKKAEELTVKLGLNPEIHDLVVDQPFVFQPNCKLNRNSHRPHA